MSLLINHFYRFGQFTLDADQRVLLREGKPLPLAPKVLETLLILVETSGRIVEKEELMNQLWPDTFVEESNLTYSIVQLRKSLGDDARRPRYIETVARRGYRFIADVEEVLSDRTEMTGQIIGRLESSDPRAPGARTEATVRLEEQESAIAIEPAAEDSSAVAEKSFKSTADQVATGVSTRYVSLAAAIVIVLVGAGLAFWKFSTNSNKSFGENKQVDSRSYALSPLKLERLTQTGQSRQVAISPDGKYIAYTRALKGKASVWLRQLATNTNVEIVPPGGLIHGLAFAHSGEYLLFVSGDPRTLYRVSPLGGVPTKIVENLTANFSISANDSQIAFIRWVINRDGLREYSLIIADWDGAGERTLFVGAPSDRLDVPIWSGDGRAIICAQGNSEGGGQKVGLIEVKIANGMKRELTHERFFRISKLASLPEENGLLVSARKNLGSNNQLWRVSYPGLEIRQVTEDLLNYLDLSIASGVDKGVATQSTLISDIWVGPNSEPGNLKKMTQARGDFCWTPDSRLVYTSTANGNHDLWIMQSDGTAQRQLTNDPAVDYSPVVTSDNRYIVFSSNRTGSLQVWRMNLDGGNQIQLTHGAAKWHPTAVSPDGNWVLYNSTDNWHLWKISIDGGEPVRLTEYYAIRPAISPNGKMIACINRTESRRELLILPFEGGQPLMRLDFVDVTSRLQWTSDGQALLYAIQRDGATVLRKQPLSGGPPKEIADFDEDELFDFGYSFDGQYFAVTRGGWRHDIVLISDLSRVR